MIFCVLNLCSSSASQSAALRIQQHRMTSNDGHFNGIEYTTVFEANFTSSSKIIRSAEFQTLKFRVPKRQFSKRKIRTFRRSTSSDYSESIALVGNFQNPHAGEQLALNSPISLSDGKHSGLTANSTYQNLDRKIPSLNDLAPSK